MSLILVVTPFLNIFVFTWLCADGRYKRAKYSIYKMQALSRMQHTWNYTNLTTIKCVTQEWDAGKWGGGAGMGGWKQTTHISKYTQGRNRVLSHTHSFDPGNYTIISSPQLVFFSFWALENWRNAPSLQHAQTRNRKRKREKNALMYRHTFHTSGHSALVTDVYTPSVWEQFIYV